MISSKNMKLSDRVRAGSEAAPWVIEEIRRLEDELDSAICEVYKKEDELVACTNLLMGFSVITFSSGEKSS